MTQPQALTIQQLKSYQDRVANAGTLAQQKSAAIAGYQELYDKGYNYAGWALGVATGSTVAGTAAMDFLTGSALMGLGGEQCRDIQPAKADKIRVDMFDTTLEQMIFEAGRSNGVLTQDLGYKSVSDIHEEVFSKNGLSLDNWTLNTPMKLITQIYGPATTEKIWSYIRDTGGDGLDGAGGIVQTRTDVGANEANWKRVA